MRAKGFMCYEWTATREVDPTKPRDFESFVTAHFDESWTQGACTGRCFKKGLGRASELICAEHSAIVPEASVGPRFFKEVTSYVARHLDCVNSDYKYWRKIIEVDTQAALPASIFRFLIRTASKKKVVISSRK